MVEAIIVQNVGKRFYSYHNQRPRTIMEAALSDWRHIKPREYFWALRDLNFNVLPGEILGIIGKNGAGKSTLLRLLGGVGLPDSGRIRVNGRIGALLDLGASLHPDLTGRENIFVCGVVAGLTRREVARRVETIVDFAELWQFVDYPVRTYSSGMMMRLAFSVAIQTDPMILLVDEFLSVGDRTFQNKCLEKINQLKANGTAVVFISHNHDQIQSLCHRALWLHQGQIVAQGEAKLVIEQYLSHENEIKSLRI